MLRVEYYTDNCAVCWEDSLKSSRTRFMCFRGPWRVVDPSTVGGKRCCHVFHRTCIEPWLEKSNTCPTCHQEFEDYFDTLERTIQKNEKVVPCALLMKIPYARMYHHLLLAEKDLSEQNRGKFSAEQLACRQKQYDELVLCVCSRDLLF